MTNPIDHFFPSLTSISTTTLASITDAAKAHYLPAPAYKISKAAMNSLTVQYALDFEKEGFTFVALSPGVRFPSRSPSLRNDTAY